MARLWKIDIPVRPKAVQSVRGGSRGFYVAPAVRKWKNAILPYIRKVCATVGAPSKLPLRINRIEFVFKCPQATPKKIKQLIAQGVSVVCIGRADLTDNLMKGLIDTCAGLVFENDKQIWHVCHTCKLYGLEDRIHIEFEETPDVFLLE